MDGGIKASHQREKLKGEVEGSDTGAWFFSLRLRLQRMNQVSLSL